MRILVLALLAAAAVAPVAGAEQACVWQHGHHCDDHLACAYDRLTGQWRCLVETHEPCDPATCDPTRR